MKTCRARHSSLMIVLLAATAAYGAPAVSPGIVATTLPAAAPGATPAPLPGPGPAKPPVSPDVGSYDIGLMLGGQLQHNGVVPTLSMDQVIRGLKDAVGGRAIKPEERDAALRFLHDAHDALAEKNRAAGRVFLARNAKEPGVKTTPSGLQYRVLAPGDPKGKSPAPTDQVTIRYKASLSDGTEFDRSDMHDRPATFRVNSVLKGWQEAFLAMKPGAKWQLFVPPELGYGADSPPGVPPGSLLVYELELLQIEPGAPIDPNAARRRPPGAIQVPVGPDSKR